MNKSIKKIFTFLAIAIIMSVFAGSEQGVKIESKYGLPILYKMRNAYSPPKPPDNVFVVTPYKTRKAGMPDALRDWDRTEHATIISKLSQMGVAVMAMDMFFRDPHLLEDDVLAQAIKQADNVIINQLARPITYIDGRVKENILRNPIEPLASAASVLAPTLVLSDQSRIDAFLSFYQVIYDQNNHLCFGYPNDAELAEGSIEHYGKALGTNHVATLPVAALEFYLSKNGEIEKYFESSDYINKNVSIQNDCENDVKNRKQLANNADLIDQVKHMSNDNKPFNSWLMLIEQLSLHQLKQTIQPSFNLNFYGQPQSLQTLDYDEVNQLYDLITSNEKGNVFKNSIVFIGGSFDEPADQIIDDFNTIFTKGELPMSGVEVAATGFANLYENSYLNRHTNRDAFLTTLLISLCMVMLAMLVTTKKLVFAALAIALGYIVFTVNQFSINYNWLAFFIPCLALLLMLLYELFDRFYLTSKDKARLQENLQLYLSSTVASQVTDNKEFELEQAICMVTDVAGFTTLGETLSPEKLHALNRDYFELLFNSVTEYGADVIKTYGDSLTAVWKVKDDSSYTSAVEAGLNILDQVEQFNTKHPNTPFETRIGLSSGQIVIGYVGGKSQRTVELTGDAIYTASRLEQYNKQTHTKFLSTKAIIANANEFNINHIGKKQLKGQNKYTEIIEVISIK